MRRRHPLLFAIPTCAAALSLAPVAARADLIPAPPSQASAVAAQVGSLLDVSKTAATANSDTGSADASVVRLGGEPLLGLGGSQSGDGQTGGSLLDTGTALPARVQVAPWAAAVHGSHSPTRQARSSAAVARAAVPDVVDAGVLTSESEATHTDQKSSGTAVTDGFQASVLGAIRLVLLHSEVSSEGGGHSYLLGLNGTEIGTDDQLGASPLCALNAPAVLSLSCLTSSGGSGSVGGVSEAAAQVAQVTPALDALAALDPVAAFTAAATSGSGQTPAAPAASSPTTALAADTSRATSPAAASTGASGAANALARTGTTAASLAAGAAALLLLGLALRRFGLRPAMN